MFSVTGLLITLLIVYPLYLYGKRNHNYWKKRGVKYEEPVSFFGGFLIQFTEKLGFSGRFAKLYKDYPNEKYVGFYQGQLQGLLIRDPGLIKQVLLTDFRSFHCRPIILNKHVVEPLAKNLFNANGDIWKLMRQKLSPTFSSGKLKAMFPLIVEQTDRLLSIADSHAVSGDEINIRELMARYNTDFIGACGFGLETDTLNEDDSDFRKLGKSIFNRTIKRFIIVTLKMIFPTLFEHFKIFEPEIEQRLVSLVKQIMSQRNYVPSGKNDFIDLMLELRQKGKIVGESIEKHNPDGSPATVELEVDDALLTAQVFVFFAAGFETSSSASSFLLHLLAYHPDKQIQCQKEIDEVLSKYDGKLCFDAIREMKYLEMALKESLRIFPSPGVLIRKSVTNYTFPDLTVEEGTIICISVEALHLDKKYFDNPEEFRPERFHPDNVENINKHVYMPFGEGPRACVGERLGIMQSMAGIAAVLSKFSVFPTMNSILKPRIDPKSGIVQNIIGGLPLTLKRRE